MTDLQRAIAMIAEIEADFAELITALYDQRWTGHVGLDFRAGVPHRADLPGLRVRLLDPSAGKHIDKPSRVVDAVAV